MPVVKDFVVELLPVDQIFVVTQRRELNEAVVASIASSIGKIGLQTPITVRLDDTIPDPDTGEEMGGFALVTGRHRLEAFRRLGLKDIPAVVRSCDETQARKWEIAENLHRAELTAQERDEHIAEWIRLTEEERQSAQSDPIESKRKDGKGHRQEGGINAAARDLGIERKDAQRAVKTASLSEQAKQTAREIGLDNNRGALLTAANELDAEKQVEVLKAIAKAKAASKRNYDDDPDMRDLATAHANKLARKYTVGQLQEYLDHFTEATATIIKNRIG